MMKSFLSVLTSTTISLLLAWMASATSTTTLAFSTLPHSRFVQCSPAKKPTNTILFESSSPSLGVVESYLRDNHGMFWANIMSKNDDVWKQLRNNDNSGMTVFAPTDDAMSALGEKRLVQLRDNRNEEMVQRMAAFHAVNEAVPVTQLFDSAGVVPLAKEVVVVDRSSTGGMFGVGGQEDGGVIVGGARVVSTLVLAGDGNAKEQILVHATDGLVSPKMLWRYCDQLRIPGSQ